MAGQPCAAHPNEVTFVRCGRCEKPICTRCMVDTPVGKKCRPCARNQTHLSESNARQVAQGFLGALVIAIPAAWIWHQVFIFILAIPYGWLVGEVAFRASLRSRSLAVQIAAGCAAFIGVLLGAVIPSASMLAMPPGVAVVQTWFPFFALLSPVTWLFAAIGTAAAVSKVRYL